MDTMREHFYEWLDKNVNEETWDMWSEYLKAHDDFPLFLSFLEGVKFGQKCQKVKEEVGMIAYCKDCVFICKPCGALYEPHPESICMAADEINFVTGEMEHLLCEDVNIDGKCGFYYSEKGKGKGGDQAQIQK
jgi:hypothetical protein